MEFKIRLVSYTGDIVTIEAEEAGIDVVDQIRRELGLQHLSLDRISGEIRELYLDTLLVTLPEHIARQSLKFRTSNIIDVEVPPEFLYRFARRRIHSESNNATGDVRLAWAEWEIPTDRLINEWIDAKYPIKWGFDKEEKEE